MKEKSEIPKTWALTALDEVGIIASGGTPSTKEPEFWEGEIPWVSPADLTGYKSKLISKGRKSISASGLQASSAKLLPKNTVLFSSRAPIGYVAIAQNELATNQGFKNLITTESLSSDYVYHFLKSAKQLAESMASGTTFLELSAKRFAQIPLPLPPLNEQHRIVSKIEELFSELDNGIANLKLAQQQLKVYRQALLKQAFEGQLTEAWRAEHTPEPASALLERIRTERQARYEQELKEWKAAVKAWERGDKKGKKPGKPKAPKELPPLTKEEVKALPELPEGWGMIFPEDVLSPKPYSLGIGPFGSNLKVSDYRDMGVPLVFVRNITHRDFDRDLRYVEYDKAKELEAHSVYPEDIVITKMGDPPGDCAIYPRNKPKAILTADCLKFRVWSDFVSREYFKYAIEAPIIKSQLGAITKGVAQKKISTARFQTLKFPFPSREEQIEVVQILEEQFSIVESLETTITQNLQRAETLRQSILKKAFEGRLVPQDPEDEPASELLKRIKEEKEAYERQQRGAKNASRKKAKII